MIRFFGLIIQFTVAAAAIVGALFDLTNKQTSSESQSQICPIASCQSPPTLWPIL